MHTNFFNFCFAACTNIDIHIFLYYNLSPLFSGKQVWWFYTNHPNDIAFLSFDNNPLTKQHLIKPATQRQKF